MPRSAWSAPFDHPRWNEQDAREVIASLDRCGQPVSEFAAEHGLDVQRVYLWRRRPAGDAPAQRAVEGPEKGEGDRQPEGRRPVRPTSRVTTNGLIATTASDPPARSRRDRGDASTNNGERPYSSLGYQQPRLWRIVA